MKYLFVHQNFPGQYLHFIRHLLKDKHNEIVFIAEPNPNVLQGVRRVSYQMPKSDQESVHPNARDYELAARRAELVAGMAANVKRLGFTPDIIIGHHGWGELLNIGDVFPGVPVLGYFEFYYRTEGQDVGFDAEFPVTPERFPRIRAMNATNLLALALDQRGQTPTRWQRDRYPRWAHRQIKVLPEGARLDLCKPNPSIRKSTLKIGDFSVTPKQKLVTYVTRNLEPYRGFHVMMRALPHLLKARPDIRVVIVGGDEVSYGARLVNTTWREHFLHELAGKFDQKRVLLPGQVSYEVFIQLLQRSDAHVYLTYPFVASWSLREALACGCAVVGGDVEPVREFIADGQTGLLTPCLDPQALSDRVLEVLENPKLNRQIRTGARKYAEAHLRMEDHIAAFEARVTELVA